MGRPGYLLPIDSSPHATARLRPPRIRLIPVSRLSGACGSELPQPLHPAACAMASHPRTRHGWALKNGIDSRHAHGVGCSEAPFAGSTRWSAVRSALDDVIHVAHSLVAVPGRFRKSPRRSRRRSAGSRGRLIQSPADASGPRAQLVGADPAGLHGRAHWSRVRHLTPVVSASGGGLVTPEGQLVLYGGKPRSTRGCSSPARCRGRLALAHVRSRRRRPAAAPRE
jgi:hypothetical protein